MVELALYKFTVYYMYPNKISLEHLLPPFREAKGNDIWGWHDGDEDYIIMGCFTGTSFLRVTDPDNVEVLGFLPTQTSSTPWRDMKVINQHVYIVAEAADHGVQVLSINFN